MSNINPEKPFWSTSDELSKKDTTPSVFNVHLSLRNNSFTNELLKNKDLFFRAVSNIDDVDIPQVNNVNIPLTKKNKVNIPNDGNMNLPFKNNDQYSVPDKCSPNKVAIPIINIVTVNATTNNTVGLKKNKTDIPPINNPKHLMMKVRLYLPTIIIKLQSPIKFFLRKLLLQY